jgi:DNA (cytosine-5)-methyltransferase 1
MPLITKFYKGVVGHEVTRPLGTVTAWDHHALTAAFLSKHYGTSKSGAGVDRPMPTVTAGGNHLAEVRAFLIKYYGAQTAQQQGLFDPRHTVTAKARFGLVMVHGEPYQIVDIGMRMLQPHELFAAQGFPDWYDIRPEHNGKPMTKEAQTSLAGNSVCPPVAEAIVAANAMASAVAA